MTKRVVLSKVAKSRLAEHIRFMREVNPVGHFAMDQWVAHNGDTHIGEVHGITFNTKLSKKHLNECGMAACSAGHAATNPKFIKLGFRLSDGYGSRVPEYQRSGADWAGVYRGYDALIAFFDITSFQAKRLFGLHLARKIKTPKQWAAHANRLVAQWS